MALKSKRPCKRFGCAELVDTGYCDTHKQYSKQDEMWRGTSASRGYDSQWRRVRVLALKKSKYLCVRCLEEGLVTIAVDVDHRVPIAQAPELRLDISNLDPLCRDHHARKTLEDKKRYTT